jgi:hypothetical protein
MLNYDPRQGGYVVDLDRRKIESAPSYTLNKMPDWSDKNYGHRLDRYYGVAPAQSAYRRPNRRRDASINVRS